MKNQGNKEKLQLYSLLQNALDKYQEVASHSQYDDVTNLNFI